MTGTAADAWRRVCFWILGVGALSYFVFEAVTAAAWPAPGYSYRDNYVSDLGVPPAAVCGETGDRFVCSPAYGVMNTGFFVVGAATLVGLLALGTLFTGARRVVTMAFALLQGVGVAMVGFAPGSFAEDLTNDQVQMVVHSLGALFGILGTAVHAIVFGVWELSRRSAARRGFGIASLVLGLAAPVGLVLQGASGVVNLGLGRGGFERIGVYSAILWLALMAAYGLTALRRRVAHRRHATT
ncbi:DUF998 domain-containing protein [Microbacterium sp. bgisy203]|uniref:DUF998 domain-containing protein n=1 Tax=Microbacterium sp. bgisy203 TaxID=3413799 RepID=UPI003D71215B